MIDRAPWSGSIRFRLTAWYATIVLAVILALGFAFSVLLERELRSDVDARILATATRVRTEIEVYSNRDTGALQGVLVPPPDFYSFPSLLIQVVDETGEPLLSSENLNDPNAQSNVARVLPTRDSPAGSAEPEFETAELGGVQIRTVRLPLVLTRTRETVGAVNVGEPLIQLEQTLAHVRRLLFVGAAFGVAFAAVSGWFLAGRALRPVARITATAASIAEGAGVSTALSTRLDVGRAGDELTNLASTFNRMLNRLQGTFESQQRFIADASHELRTPLTAIRGNVDVLALQVERGETPKTEIIETLNDLRLESERMGRLVEDLLTLVRTEAPAAEEVRRHPVRLDELANEVARVATGLAKNQRIDVSPSPEVTVAGDRDRLFQVMLILIDNAIRHTPEGGIISIRVGSERDSAELKITDSGYGIAREHLPHLFERFYRADSSRQRGSGGTGLGLAIAKAIVESHHGTIDVASSVGIGTTFTIHLPLYRSERPDEFEEPLLL